MIDTIFSHTLYFFLSLGSLQCLYFLYYIFTHRSGNLYNTMVEILISGISASDRFIKRIKNYRPLASFDIPDDYDSYSETSSDDSYDSDDTHEKFD